MLLPSIKYFDDVVRRNNSSEENENTLFLLYSVDIRWKKRESISINKKALFCKA
jgi:hypothetical protein